jgi:hypothetical protein
MGVSNVVRLGKLSQFKGPVLIWIKLYWVKIHRIYSLDYFAWY